MLNQVLGNTSPIYRINDHFYELIISESGLSCYVSINHTMTKDDNLPIATSATKDRNVEEEEERSISAIV